MESKFTKEVIEVKYKEYRNGFHPFASFFHTTQWILTNGGNTEDIELLTEIAVQKDNISL